MRLFFYRLLILLSVSLTLLTDLSGSTTAFQDRPKVIVFPFETENLDSSHGALASDLVQTLLIKYRLAEVLDRDNIDKILKEQEFQRSGCTEEECMVAIGKIVNAEKIISGELLKINKLMLVNIQMIDLTSGQIIWTHSINTSDINELKTELEGYFNKLIVIDKESLKEKGLIFWNKLGSIEELENSEIGKIIKHNGELTFDHVKHGKGLTVTSSPDYQLEFQAPEWSPYGGCIEFWILFYELPFTNKTAQCGIIKGVNKRGEVSVDFRMERGISMGTFLNFGKLYRIGPHLQNKPKTNVLYHFAITWEKTPPGEKGHKENRGKYVLYKNGNESIRANLALWGEKVPSGEIMKIGEVVRGDQKKKKFFTIDNIKIWNYPKKDFSDRFTE